jgi:bifunctional oligoribonuclease and PAP phosphatase NrnA
MMETRSPANLSLAKAIEQIRRARSVLIVSHIRPDGDAVGSLLGLGLALQGMGKQVQMVLEDGVPPGLRHLPGCAQVCNQASGTFDLVCVVDSSDLERTGKVLLNRPQPDLNIDHHRTNLNFARTNLVDSQAVATCEIVAHVLMQIGFKIDLSVASALLTGLITDTIGFRTSNVSPRSLRLAAELMEAGADMPTLYQRALVNKPFEAIRMWAAGLGKVQREHRLAWTTITNEDRRSAGYPGRDDADLVNILSAIDDIDIAMMFIEQPEGKVKVSWRAQPGIDVSAVALRFGGGGHAAAAGAEISGSLAEVQAAVLEQTRPILTGGHHV